MTTEKITPKTIDEYIAAYPKDIQEILEKIRTTVRKAAPGAEESIKYGMPTFTLQGNLVSFGAFKRHIGFFPPVRGMEKFRNERSVYEGPKGNLKFPLDQPIPFDMIGEIVRFRVEENSEKAEEKRRNKKAALSTQ